MEWFIGYLHLNFNSHTDVVTAVAYRVPTQSCRILINTGTCILIIISIILLETRKFKINR